MSSPRPAAVLLLLLGLCAGAARADVRYGFLIGANRSTVSGDTRHIFAGPDFEAFENLSADVGGGKLGMTAGLFMVADVDRDVNLRMEALYSEMGGQGDFSGTIILDGLGETDLSGTAHLKTSYIEVPVLLLFPLPGLPQTRWRGMLGMAGCYATGSELRLDSVIEGYPYSDPLDWDERIETFTYHGIVGLEYTAYLKETPFLFGLRYEMGLRRFGTDPGGRGEDYRHRSLGLSLGIVF
jgi:hypothetical protein